MRASVERGLSIGRAAEAAGVGVETIRFYEREGFIERPARPATGPRLYSPELVERIRFIQDTQRLGFTLADVRELLALEADAAAGRPGVAERAAEAIAEVRAKIKGLHRLTDRLRKLAARS